MSTTNDINPAPWNRSDWTGELVSVDGCPCHDFTVEDVARVVEWATTADDWDGDTAGIIELTDGRFVSWEAGWGPAENGFCADAYGGTADLNFAHTEASARSYLSEQARDLLRGAK